jgi:hypothetical protein
MPSNSEEDAMKKITITGLAVCSLILLMGAVHGQTVQTTSGKGRFIRSGESLDALRANTLQTMDFAIDALTDHLGKVSDREDRTIIPWEDTLEKYMGQWNNNCYQMELYFKENKMDLKEHYEWKKKYDKYFAEVFADGYQVLHWKWMMEIERKLLDYDLKDYPSMIKEYKIMIREANSFLDEAESVGFSDRSRAYSRATQAVNMAEKVSSSLRGMKRFIESARKKKKTSLDSNISAVKSRLQAIPSTYSDLMSRWNEKTSGWAKFVDDYWKIYKDSWEEWEEESEVFTKVGLFNDYSHFNGVSYDQLETVAEKIKAKY